MTNFDEYNDRFFSILIFMIRKQLPQVYLECFNDLNKSLKKIRWPDRPKKYLLQTLMNLMNILNFTLLKTF